MARMLLKAGGVAAALGIALTGCARGPVAETGGPTSAAGFSSAATSSSTPTGPAAGSCEALAQTLTLERQVGQLFMVGIPSTASSVPQQVSTMIAAGKVGSVILVGDTTSGVDGVARLTTHLVAISPTLPVMVAADQEGGNVQRLRGAGFDRIPSATQQSRQSDSDLRFNAAQWGGQLQQAGVTYNLAPVGDVVPRSLGNGNPPIGRLNRGFGSDPAVVSAKVTAVIKGYHNANVATAIKHFPGLGKVTKNTDTAADVVDTETSADSASLEPFRAGIAAGTNSVMVSNATYTLIDSRNPAAFSSTVMSLLREDLGFNGVIISDDLGSAKAVGATPVDDRGVRFLSAGGDLVLNVDSTSVEGMVAHVVAKAKTEPAFASEIATKTARVLKLKASTGLVTCS